MSRPVVLLDVDGVVADLVSPVTAKLLQFLGLPQDTLTASDVDRWDIAEATWCKVSQKAEVRSQDFTLSEISAFVAVLFSSQGFVASLPVYDGAYECVERISKVADVYFVTAGRQESRYWDYERAQWLKQNFWGLYKGVVVTEHKYLVRGDFFIDDKIENVEVWGRQSTGCCYVLDQPWNRNEGNCKSRVSISQFADIVESAT